MGKFAIQCPHCENYVTAHNGLRGLVENKITCGSCGQEIDVKAERKTTCVCPNCGMTVLYDQGKKTPKCPVCNTTISALDGRHKMLNFNCPQCHVGLVVPSDMVGQGYTCPVCDKYIENVRKEVEKLRHHGLVDLIKFDGDNNTMVYKFPFEDFSAGAQLIVHESQEAIFFRGGQALQTFTSYGSPHTLDAIYMPGTEEIYKLPTGDTRGTFHSEVYFVNMAETSLAKWGTDEKVRFKDPTAKIMASVGCRGSFKLKVTNSRKLVIRLVGTTEGLKLIQTGSDSGEENPSTPQAFNDVFKANIMPMVKSYLAARLPENLAHDDKTILDIHQYLELFSNELKEQISAWLDDQYGLTLASFTLANFYTSADDENDPNYKAWTAYQRNQELASIGTQKESAEAAVAEVRRQKELIEAQTEAQKRMIEAQAEAEAKKAMIGADIYRMQGMGYTYQDETQRQVSLAGMKALENGLSSGGGGGASDGASMVGSLAATGMALGAMGSVAGTFMDSIGGVVQKGSQMGASVTNASVQHNPGQQPQKPDNTWDCPNCGTKGLSLDWGFCPKCRAEQPKPAAAPETWDCPNCGTGGLSQDWGICPKCGSKRPEPEPAAWDCPNCGTSGLSLDWGICPKCGSKRPEPEPAVWDCPNCGTKGLSSDWNICPKCQYKKGEGSDEN